MAKLFFKETFFTSDAIFHLSRDLEERVLSKKLFSSLKNSYRNPFHASAISSLSRKNLSASLKPVAHQQTLTRSSSDLL